MQKIWKTKSEVSRYFDTQKEQLLGHLGAETDSIILPYKEPVEREHTRWKMSPSLWHVPSLN